MKIGSCLLLLATPDDPLAIESIPLVAASGYDYAEVSLARMYDLSGQEVDHYCAAFERNNLPVEVFNNAIPRSVPLVGPDVSQDKWMAYIEKALSLARRMGAHLITMSGPNKRRVPETFTWEEGFPQYAAFLRLFAEEAAASGITLAIEPINDEESGFIATVSEARRAMEAAGCDNIGVIVDIYHFCKQRDSMDDLLALVRAGKLVHIHHAVPGGRTYPQERDFEESKWLLLPLVNAGYAGRISVEAYADVPDRQLPVASRLLHTL